MQYLTAIPAGRYDLIAIFASDCNNDFETSFPLCNGNSYRNLFCASPMYGVYIYTRIYFPAFASNCRANCIFLLIAS